MFLDQNAESTTSSPRDLVTSQMTLNNPSAATFDSKNGMCSTGILQNFLNKREYIPTQSRND